MTVHFTAKARTNANGTVAQYVAQWGEAQYTIFASDYAFSLGHLKNVPATGVWTVFCMSRRDIALDLVPSQDFDSRDQALAFIRETYEAALSEYASRTAEVFAMLAGSEGISPVVGDGSQMVRVKVIYRDAARQFGQASIQIDMTVQEALTGLDYGYARGEYVFAIVGGLIADQPGRTSYADWRIPPRGDNYVLMGVRSTTGQLAAWGAGAAPPNSP